MAQLQEPSKNTETVKYTVVTGANKGIGFEICKQLASHGIMVVLTARDEKRGLEAVEKLKEFGFSDNIIFHQLNVLDPSIPSEWAKSVLNDAEKLTEESIDHVLNEFLKDFKVPLKPKAGLFCRLHTVSKAVMNAYTRILAKKYPHFRINCVSPGFVKTDMTYYTGILTAEESAEGPVMVALLPDDGPSGLFFERNEVPSF